MSKRQIDRLSSALALAEQGFRIFPLSPRSKKPPRDFAWKEEATTDPDRIREWWKADANYNVGVATGGGTIVVDADTKEGAPGLASLGMLELACGMPKSFRVQTPSGGMHVYLRVDQTHRNRVHSIPDYPGIDIRSDNGYVVGPGSVVDGKPYVAIPGAIEPAGAEVEAALLANTPTHTVADSKAPAVELDLPAHIDLAKEYLVNRAPEAVEGAGGNETTYTVAARCREYGLTQEATLDIMLEHWNETKAFPAWLPADLQTVVANAYRYATGSWGGGMAVAEFDVVDGGSDYIGENGSAETQAALGRAAERARASRRRLPVVSFADAVAGALEDGAEPLIDGILDQGTVAVLYGPSNIGKTFVAYDLSAAIASGQAWNGYPTTKSSVLYIATEGGKASFKRLAALAKFHNLPADTTIHVVPASVNLFESKADCQPIVAECRALAAATDLPVRLIVVDTLARAMAGGDENSGKDMTQFVHNIDQIKDATGATILVVHHTGKDAAKGMRGHSSLLASIDTDFEIKREGNSPIGVLSNHKQRDYANFTDLRFTLEVVPLGQNSKGRLITSCAVRWLTDFEEAPLPPPAESLLESLRSIGKPATGAEWYEQHYARIDPNWMPGRQKPKGCSEPNLNKLRKMLVEFDKVLEKEQRFTPVER
ncbi:MAG: hypothetical protein BGN83_18285 [Rhizobium sp. 63-7]|mgnify:CR=1 FL=1|nr:MAG: hypothetical protein BGN83_18285 [Rhizobium sp. 63-7]